MVVDLAHLEEVDARHAAAPHFAHLQVTLQRLVQIETLLKHLEALVAKRAAVPIAHDLEERGEVCGKATDILATAKQHGPVRSIGELQKPRAAEAVRNSTSSGDCILQSL